ncbi:MAG: hypothetical protein U9Q70_06545, partial [Chloroflexota bacterium]|nr:hypothetical protein [Chloroflexota bacterium]
GGMLLSKGPAEASIVPAVITPQPTPHQVFLPLVAGPPGGPTYFYDLTYPANWFLTRRGPDLASASANITSTAVYTQHAATGAWNSPPADFYPHYELTRGFLHFEPTAVPTHAIILSATLELPALNLGNWPTTLSVEQGGWSGTPDAGDWDNYTRQLGNVALDATSWYLKVPLPGLVNQPLPTVFKLVLRTDETVELSAGLQGGGAFDLNDEYASDGQVVMLRLQVELPPEHR